MLIRVGCNVSLFKSYIVGVVVMLYLYTALQCLQRTLSFFSLKWSHAKLCPDLFKVVSPPLVRCVIAATK